MKKHKPAKIGDYYFGPSAKQEWKWNIEGTEAFIKFWDKEYKRTKKASALKELRYWKKKLIKLKKDGPKKEQYKNGERIK